MTNLIDKYLKQIKKKLHDNSISQEYIEEFLENLSDQLVSMQEEIQNDQPTLDSEDVSIKVLTQCEPVEIVVKRVIKELRENELRIETVHTNEIKILRPLESFLLFLLKRTEMGYIYCRRKIKNLFKNVIESEDPVVKSFTFFTVIIAIIFGIATIFYYIPLFIIITQPNDKIFYSFFGDCPINILANPEITSYEIINVSTIFSNFLLLLLVSGILISLGWKYSYHFALKTGIFLSFLISCFFMFWQGISRREYILFRRISEEYGNTFTPDWTRTIKFSQNEYFEYLLKVNIFNFITCGAIIIILILLGSFLRFIIKKDYAGVIKTYQLKGISKACFFIVCLIIVSFSLTNYPDFPKKIEVTVPPVEESFIYCFEIDTSGYTSFSYSNYEVTILSEFGNLYVNFQEFYNLSFKNYNNLKSDLYKNGSFSGIIYDKIVTKKPFSLLGLLYMPNQHNNLGIQEIVTNFLNDSYPYQGFIPSIEPTINTIEWIIEGKKTNLIVNTIRYNSLPNRSEFLFNFDSETGWLMKAVLVKDNSTWIAGRNLNTLLITRWFSYNIINSPKKYFSEDSKVTIFFLSGIIGLFGISEIVFKFRKKSGAKIAKMMK